jgi:hypothetical protein
MTKDSAEEKIVQIGRKKMALDQALIESMDAEDDAGVDLESILKHGAAALFDDDDTNDIHYDSASVDKLLDRTQVENTEMGKDKTAESQFSFARVWANDKGALTEDVGDPDAEQTAPDHRTWENILKNREAEAAAEASKNEEALGRGKRARIAVDYKRGTPGPGEDLVGDDPTPQKRGRKRRERDDSGSDVDFAGAGDTDRDDESEGIPEPVDPQELGLLSQTGRSRSKFVSQKGTKGKLLINSRSTPQKQVPSDQRARGSATKGGLTITLNFSARSVKAQKGAQKPVEVVKKPAIGNKAQPNMGTVAKQSISKNTASSGKKQAAQTNGRSATPNGVHKAQVGPAKLNAPRSGKAQLARVNGLPAKPNNVKKYQPVPKDDSASRDGEEQPAQISGRPTTPNSLGTQVTSAMASATNKEQVLANGRGSRPVIGGPAARDMPSKMPLDSSDGRSQVPLDLRNAPDGHHSSETHSQPPANTTSFQNPTTLLSNTHLSFPHNDLASTARCRTRGPATVSEAAKTHNMATKPQLPSPMLSTKRIAMSSTIPPSLFQSRARPEERRRTQEVPFSSGFSLKIDTDKMEEDKRRNAKLDMAMQRKFRNHQAPKSTPQVPWFSLQMDIDKVQAQNSRSRKVEPVLSAASHI